MGKVAFGVHLPVMGIGSQEPAEEEILASARLAEKLGFDSISVNDHISYRTSWLDSLESIAAVASVTSKIKIGTSVLNVVVRNPVICMKALSSIDILSSGRLFAGIGPGSHKADYEATGIMFEERWGRFREGLEILSSFWGSDSISYSGKFYELENISIKPRPTQQPHPPLLVGSWGSETILKAIARYADGWMASAYNITPEEFKRNCNSLLSYRRHNRRDNKPFENSVMTMFCYISPSKEKSLRMASDMLSPALGRRPEDLERLLPFENSDECIRRLSRLAEAGAQRVHFWPVSDYAEQLEILANEVVPAFK